MSPLKLTATERTGIAVLAMKSRTLIAGDTPLSRWSGPVNVGPGMTGRPVQVLLSRPAVPL